MTRHAQPPKTRFPHTKLMLGLLVVTLALTYGLLRKSATDAEPRVYAGAQERAAPLVAVPRGVPRSQALEPLVSVPTAPAPLQRREPSRSLHRRMVQAPLSKDALPPPSARLARPTTLFAEERTLLDSARNALRHADTNGARAALQQHEGDFAAGGLEQEREALWVLLLVSEGARDAALVKAEAFLERWPNSVFARSVKDAAKGTPSR